MFAPMCSFGAMLPLAITNHDQANPLALAPASHVPSPVILRTLPCKIPSHLIQLKKTLREKFLFEKEGRLSLVF